MLKVNQRPERGSAHVKDQAELIVGKQYRQHCGGSVSIIQVLEAPFQDKDGGWWVLISEGLSTREISLADFGVVAYPTGAWSPTNWLERL